jgi:hypothetical protein
MCLEDERGTKDNTDETWVGVEGTRRETTNTRAKWDEEGGRLKV